MARGKKRVTKRGRKRHRGGSLSSLLRRIKANRNNWQGDAKVAARLAVPALAEVTKRAFLGFK